jgi:four helix bundle protein
MNRDSEAPKLRTKDFALRVLRLYRSLPRTPEARILGTQLLRCSTSIGANYRAACRGRSRAEFVAKLGIVLGEADETVFGLELFEEGNIFPAEKCAILCRRRTRLNFCPFRAHSERGAIGPLTSHPSEFLFRPSAKQ